jgi:hypothetical protein
LAGEGEMCHAELQRELESLRELVDRVETETLLSGTNDGLNAIMTIHPGGGRDGVAGLGRDAAAHVFALGGAAGIQDRDVRLPAGGRSGHQVGDVWR